MAVSGLPISTDTDSYVWGFSQMQPGMSGSVPVGFPSVAAPSSVAIWPASINAQASIGAAGAWPAAAVSLAPGPSLDAADPFAPSPEPQAVPAAQPESARTAAATPRGMRNSLGFMRSDVSGCRDEVRVVPEMPAQRSEAS